MPEYEPLTEDMRAYITRRLERFGCDKWTCKLDMRFQVLPGIAYWACGSHCKLLDNFHLIRSREQLDQALPGFEFLDDDGDDLFELITKLNM